MSAREYVETFVKDVMEAGGHGQVDKYGVPWLTLLLQTSNSFLLVLQGL